MEHPDKVFKLMLDIAEEAGYSIETGSEIVLVPANLIVEGTYRTTARYVYKEFD